MCQNTDNVQQSFHFAYPSPTAEAQARRWPRLQQDARTGPGTESNRHFSIPVNTKELTEIYTDPTRWLSAILPYLHY